MHWTRWGMHHLKGTGFGWLSSLCGTVFVFLAARKTDWMMLISNIGIGMQISVGWKTVFMKVFCQS